MSGQGVGSADEEAGSELHPRRLLKDAEGSRVPVRLRRHRSRPISHADIYRRPLEARTNETQRTTTLGSTAFGLNDRVSMLDQLPAGSHVFRIMLNFWSTADWPCCGAGDLLVALQYI